MALQKDLVTPVDIGSIGTIAGVQLSVYCVFNEVSGVYEISSLSLSVQEGELTGSGPYSFTTKKAGQVSKQAVDIPAPIITDLEAIFEKGLVLYAAQEGYDI